MPNLKTPSIAKKLLNSYRNAEIDLAGLLFRANDLAEYADQNIPDEETVFTFPDNSALLVGTYYAEIPE